MGATPRWTSPINLAIPVSPVLVAPLVSQRRQSPLGYALPGCLASGLTNDEATLLLELRNKARREAVIEALDFWGY